jgi:hypothetical protein
MTLALLALPCGVRARAPARGRGLRARASAAPDAAAAAAEKSTARNRRTFRFVDYGERVDTPAFGSDAPTICCDGLVQARARVAPARAPTRKALVLGALRRRLAAV